MCSQELLGIGSEQTSVLCGGRGTWGDHREAAEGPVPDS